MLTIHAIKDAPPKSVTPQDALAVCRYIRSELEKKPHKTLTARETITRLELELEATCKS